MRDNAVNTEKYNIPFDAIRVVIPFATLPFPATLKGKSNTFWEIFALSPFVMCYAIPNVNSLRRNLFGVLYEKI